MMNVVVRVHIVFQRVDASTLLILDVGDAVTPDGKVTRTFPTRSGDVVKFHELNTRKLLGSASVASASVVTDPSTVDRARRVLDIMNKPPYNANIIGFTRETALLWQVRFAAALPAPVQQSAYPLVQFDAQAGFGCVVRNNRFRDSYDNTMRLQASNALIANNLFERAADGIHIEYDQPFLEGSFALRDISVVNNTFIGILGCTPANSCVSHADEDVVNLVVKDNRVL